MPHTDCYRRWSLPQVVCYRARAGSRGSKVLAGALDGAGVRFSTLAEIGVLLAEAKTLLAKLQASMLFGQVAACAAHHRACAACGVLQPHKDRRTRGLQTLFGTVEGEAPRFKFWRCRQLAPMAEAAVSPVGALLTARCTPELERVQAELGARTSFRDDARILEALLPASPGNH